MRSALFLDLGGTLLQIKDDEIHLTEKGTTVVLPHVIERLRTVEQTLIFVITNQSAIGKNKIKYEVVANWIEQIFTEVGRPLTDYWICAKEESAYRKPSPAMVEGLADKYFVNLESSVYVGDSVSDQQCANAAGVGMFIWAESYFSERYSRNDKGVSNTIDDMIAVLDI